MTQAASKADTRPLVLLADDDESICAVIRQALARKGYAVRQTDNGSELLAWVKKGAGDLVITDVRMPELDGLSALRGIREVRPELPVIVISAQSTFQTAVDADRQGANEYLPKPFDLHELLASVAALLPDSEAQPEPSSLPKKPADSPMPVGNSPAMQTLYRTLVRLTHVDLTVLLEGESGTGKEMIARALHLLGPRQDQPFIALNMAAIPRELVESELFGHEKGAFTGAHAKRKGAFGQAAGGTLFLDEIGDMPLEAQSKLLRVLQEKEYIPVGGTQTHRTEARIVCATHQDLAYLCKQGGFREDLYYRLHVVPLQIPPLRRRQEDIPLLVEHFLQKAMQKGLPPRVFGEDAMTLLAGYHWPGNVRELENLVYRACVLATQDTICPTLLRELLHLGKADDSEKRQAGTFSTGLQESVGRHLRTYFEAHAPGLPPPGVHGRVIRQVEAPLLRLTLEATGGNQIKAAELLGINRNTLRKKLQMLGIQVGRTVESGDRSK